MEMQGTGGFNSQFVTPLDKDLECPVCLLALRDPLQTSCGHLMCTSCVDRLTEGNCFKCPLDSKISLRTEVFPDLVHQRKVLGLKVNCDHFSLGCTWTGELRHLQEHLGESCPQASVSCQFASIGCTCTQKIKRKDLDEHFASSAQQHTALLLKKIESLETENEQLKAERTNATASIQLTPKLCKFTWKIDKWAEKLQSARNDVEGTRRFYSDPFYTGYHGYKLCLEARPDDKHGGYLGVYLRVMRGDYDYSLTWPSLFEFTVTLIDQQPGGHHIASRIQNLTANAETIRKCLLRPTGIKNGGIGWDTFISHQDLVSRSYIVNDSLLLEIQIHIDT